jgi:hypothetical protein
MREAENNCIGFAYYCLGLAETDEYKNLPSYGDLMEEFVATDYENGDMMAVVNPSWDNGWVNDSSSVKHLAIIDPNDRTLVIHRPATNGSTTIALREDVANDYKSYNKQWKIVYLKLKKPCVSKLLVEDIINKNKKGH